MRGISDRAKIRGVAEKILDVSDQLDWDYDVVVTPVFQNYQLYQKYMPAFKLYPNRRYAAYKLFPCFNTHNGEIAFTVLGNENGLGIVMEECRDFVVTILHKIKICRNTGIGKVILI